MGDHVVPVRTYLLIFAGLMVLTAVTVGAAFLDLGRFNTPVAMTIAVVKALLVVLWFMHLRYTERLNQVCALAAVVWLVLLIVLTLSDYETRQIVTLTGAG